MMAHHASSVDERRSILSFRDQQMNEQLANASRQMKLVATSPIHASLFAGNGINMIGIETDQFRKARC